MFLGLFAVISNRALFCLTPRSQLSRCYRENDSSVSDHTSHSFFFRIIVTSPDRLSRWNVCFQFLKTGGRIKPFTQEVILQEPVLAACQRTQLRGIKHQNRETRKEERRKRTLKLLINTFKTDVSTLKRIDNREVVTDVWLKTTVNCVFSLL